MKEVTEKSKQTVWVLTMLTVMIVLSAYYLVSDPMVTKEMLQNNDTVNGEEVNAEIDTNDVSENVENNVNILDDYGATSSSDLFIGLRMDRTNNRYKKLDQLYTMMNSDLSEEAIARVQDDIDSLLTLEESEMVLEKLIIAEGYQDAVVLANDNSVDVIIQTQSLSNANAVKIIKMVSDRLGVPAINVHLKTVKS